MLGVDKEGKTMATESGSSNNSEKSEENKISIEHQLADAAKAYNWQKVFEILGNQPNLINSTRPGGKSRYTPLHQAAHGNALPKVIQKLMRMGASLTIRNAEDERAADIAERKEHRHLIQLLSPVQESLAETSLLHFPSSVTEAQTICALRFQGYGYEKFVGASSSGETSEGLARFTAPVVNSLTLHSSNSDNFAAFFGLQRYLHKWGGEYLTKYSEAHIAYDFLFLHLYSHEPPEPFRHNEYCRRWQDDFLPRAESIAALVRESFRRIGNGKKTAL